MDNEWNRLVTFKDNYTIQCAVFLAKNGLYYIPWNGIYCYSCNVRQKYAATSPEHLKTCEIIRRGLDESTASSSTTTTVNFSNNGLTRVNWLNTFNAYGDNYSQYVNGVYPFNIDPFRESFNRPTTVSTTTMIAPTSTSIPNNIGCPGFSTTTQTTTSPLNHNIPTVTTPNSATTLDCGDSLSLEEKIVFQQYARFAVRLSSFNRWPDHKSQLPDQLAFAGFFYVGDRDCVRCFSCGGGLQHWKQGEDPIVEHARWYPKCEYLNKLKGLEFIQSVNKHSARIDRDNIVKHIIEMGYAEEHVQNAISAIQGTNQSLTIITVLDRLNTHQLSLPSVTSTPSSLLLSAVGVTSVTTTTTATTSSSNKVADVTVTNSQDLQRIASIDRGYIAERIIDMGYAEEHVQTAISAMQGTNQSLTIIAVLDWLNGNQLSLPSVTTTTTTTTTTSSSSSSSSSSSLPNTTMEVTSVTTTVTNCQDLQHIKIENLNMREQKNCKICSDKDIEVTFLPCGHFMCCIECSKSLRKCPVCRQFIEKTIYTFIS